MIPLQLYEIIKVVNGGHRNYRPLAIKRISTDTRDINKGDLFIALKGERFDGHNFITKAIRKGAAAILASKVPKGISAKTPVIKTKDTLLALGNIARYYRNRLNIPVIAVGGSNGKTTTKDMIAHILSKQSRVTKSYKSFNNFIGLPLTILAADEKTQYLVAEIGTNKPGEISYLSKILRPDIALITNISITHLDGLKNLSGVFKEESSLFSILKTGNTAVFDANNKYLKSMAKYAEYKAITFGLDSNADIRAKAIKKLPNGIGFTILEKSGYYDCFMPILGLWNIKNSLAAFTVTKLLNLKPKDICRALNNFRLPEMRMDRHIKNGVTFINDAYNANPVSVCLAITELSEMETRGRKIMVFGEMRELDKYTRRLHEAAAETIAKSRIDTLIAVGKETKYTFNKLLRLKSWNNRVFHYDNVNKAIPVLKNIVKSGDTVLLKGSRANTLEKVISL